MVISCCIGQDDYAMHTSPTPNSSYDITTLAGYRQAYDAYAPLMFGICLNKIGEEAVAEDIIQEIFSSLWEKRFRLQLKQSLRGYLIRATKYKIVDYYRQKNNHSLEPAELPALVA
ncbi:MAG: sigma factor, partial [Bacteroidota bacterium]